MASTTTVLQLSPAPQRSARPACILRQRSTISLTQPSCRAPSPLLLQQRFAAPCGRVVFGASPAPAHSRSQLLTPRWRRSGAGVCSAEQNFSQSDTTLWTGDAVVLLLTQMSSTQVSPENGAIVSILLLATWSAVAWAKRDYATGNANYDTWSVEEPVSEAVKSAALTWVIFAPLAAAVYSSLIAQHLLTAGVGHQGLAGFGSGLLWLTTPNASASAAAPEIEVLVATLFCVSAWRGLYAAYRAWSNFS